MTTLEKLSELGANMWWSWDSDALDLFRSINPDAFSKSRNSPLAALRAFDPKAHPSAQFEGHVDEVYRRFKAYLAASGPLHSAPETAYFCMEYGLHESLPLYSGGLGILAGDHLKAASDAGIPLTAIGLLHRQGYFRQSFDDELNQQVSHRTLDPQKQPLTPVLDATGARIEVIVHFGSQLVYLQAWKLCVGRIHLYLLDADVSQNSEEVRTLCHRLYQGDHRDRIRQEIILGVGGIRLLRALGLDFDVFHMNEGHCAFLSLELIREGGGGDPSDLDRVRSRCVFTTHTPVRAGHDRFTRALMIEEMSEYVSTLPMSMNDLLALGRVHADDEEELFTMTVLGLKLSRACNAVSRLNGEISRKQWNELYPSLEERQVPISHITNGIHLPTWTRATARSFLDTNVPGWNDGLCGTGRPFARASDLDGGALWKYRSSLRSELITFVRERSARQSFHQDVDLDPEALTIGFARRFAVYKRAPLFFHNPEKAAAILGNPDRPVQIIYAGKAHPADKPGQAFIRKILEFSRQTPFRGKVIFLEDYDMEIGRMLISGCDLWLNNPRRPKEACGTSGQKITIHGGLNLSILDGWWAEGYNGENGWAIDETDRRGQGPAVDSAVGPEVNPVMDPVMDSEAQQDSKDAAALYERLENEVIPLFYDARDANGIPAEWVDRMRNAMSTLAYPFSAARMIQDYVYQLYTSPSE